MTKERYPIPPPFRGLYVVIPPPEVLPWKVIRHFQISGPVYHDVHYQAWVLYYTMLPGPGDTGYQRKYMN